MIDFFTKLFSTDFMPHGYCIGRPEVIWLHQISDLFIAVSYFLIPLALLYIVRVRRDLVYPGLFLLFGVFILSCGATHVLAVYVLWHPVYRLDGIVKAITALSSFPTALILMRLAPKVKLIPSSEQLREQNVALQSEIAERMRAVEEARRLNEELERRVADRTRLLQTANEELTRANADLIRTIAEREAAQHALDSNRRFLDGITGVAPVLLYVYDLDQRENVWINNAITSILGYTPEEMQAMGPELLSALLHEEDAVRYISHLNLLRQLRDHETVEFEYRMRHKNGGWRWLISRERAFTRHSGGEVAQVAGAAQDITDRKAVEHALRESEERFRELADNISQFAWMADKDGTIYWFNRRWYDYTGVDPAHQFGPHRPSVTHPDHAARVRENFHAAICAGEPWEDTFPIRAADGTYRWFLSRALPIRHDDGTVIRWFGTNTDITDQRQVEVELRRANSDLEQFAYSASHDLKEPLRNVTVYSEAFARRYRSKLDERADTYLRFITEGASRMEALLGELLAYTEIRRDDESPADPIDPREIFDAVYLVFADKIAASQAEVVCGDLPAVRMRPGHLTLLLQNLIGNALKYCEGHPPSVRVWGEENGSTVRFAVEDNGIGIAEEYRETIFGIFKRLHTRDQYSGTGMGLAICQRIVERYGGRIWVESEQGKGSTFYFTVPR